MAGALNAALIDRGLRVYDETAITARFTDPARQRRNDAYLIEVARAISEPPIDAIIIYEITVNAPLIKGSPLRQRQPSFRIAARVLGVRDGRLFGRAEGAPDVRLPRVAEDCRSICLGDLVGDHAESIAASLAGDLAEDLIRELKRP